MSRRERSEAQAEPPYPWRIFWVLLGASVAGYLGALPYAFQVLAKLIKVQELPMPLPVFIVVQALQAVIIFGFVVGVGLVLGQRVGLETPLLRVALPDHQTDFHR